jgi:hypothetical protein
MTQKQSRQFVITGSTALQMYRDQADTVNDIIKSVLYSLDSFLNQHQLSFDTVANNHSLPTNDASNSQVASQKVEITRFLGSLHHSLIHDLYPFYVKLSKNHQLGKEFLLLFQDAFCLEDKHYLSLAEHPVSLEQFLNLFEMSLVSDLEIFYYCENVYHCDDGNVLHDLDVIATVPYQRLSDEDKSFLAEIMDRYSLYRLDYHCVKGFEALEKLVTTPRFSPHLDFLEYVQLKVSHVGLGIAYRKSIQSVWDCFRDLEFFCHLRSMAKSFDSAGMTASDRNYSLSQKIYHQQLIDLINGKLNCDTIEKLTDEWMVIHNKPKLSLRKTSREFFRDRVKRTYSHDHLHELMCFNKQLGPIYKKFVQDESVYIDWEQLQTASHQTRIDLVREEIIVLALERFVIPGKIFTEITALEAAYHLFLTKLTSGKFKQFVLRNGQEIIRKSTPTYMQDAIWAYPSYRQPTGNSLLIDWEHGSFIDHFKSQTGWRFSHENH